MSTIHKQGPWRNSKYKDSAQNSVNGSRVTFYLSSTTNLLFMISESVLSGNLSVIYV